jgi:hypothetical protein
MMKEGLPLELIAKVTGFTLDQVRELAITAAEKPED